MLSEIPFASQTDLIWLASDSGMASWLRSSDANALDGAGVRTGGVRAVFGRCVLHGKWLHSLALGDSSCDLLGALSLEFILRHG